MYIPCIEVEIIIGTCITVQKFQNILQPELQKNCIYTMDKYGPAKKNLVILVC